jgi:4-hydroxy-tetrahydrodipicolinate reductase
MKIALIGYGKMGKSIEKIAVERGHEISLKIGSNNTHELKPEAIRQADAAIEFTQPEMASKHIKMCLNSQVPIVIGTTGWYEHYNELKQLCNEQKGSMLAATNFSVGVNLFFELNRQLAKLMSPMSDYKASIEEIHHTEKLDSPSGTAITLAEGLIEEHPRYNKWENESSPEESVLEIHSKREPGVPGTHIISYESDIDRISIEHLAKNRKGFALGAVLAAEFIAGKQGVFSMKDVLKF